MNLLPASQPIKDGVLYMTGQSINNEDNIPPPASQVGPFKMENCQVGWLVNNGKSHWKVWIDN
jgi:hypothetical protein